MRAVKRRLNNSASLGRTLARKGQNAAIHHSMAEPGEFHLPQDTTQNRTIRPPSVNLPATGLGVAETLSRIKASRVQCSKRGQDIHTSLMQKSFKLSRLLRQTQQFSIHCQELGWLLREGDGLMDRYMGEVSRIAPESVHTADMQNVSKQWKGLLLRYAGINKSRMLRVDEWLKDGNAQGEVVVGTISPIAIPSPEQQSRSRVLRGVWTSAAGEKVDPSQAMKENIDNQNMSEHFSKINLTKPAQKSVKQEPPVLPTVPMVQSLQPQVHQSQAYFSQQLRQQQLHNQQLTVNNQMLLEQIESLQCKLDKYKALSLKSTQELSEVLSALVERGCQGELELLKMGRCIGVWEEMLQDEEQEQKYRELYGHPQMMEEHKRKQMRQIMGLQHQIKTLLAEKQHQVSSQLNHKTSRVQHNQYATVSKHERCLERDEDVYMMLALQAATIEEVCSL